MGFKFKGKILAHSCYIYKQDKVEKEDLVIKWLDGELNDAELVLFKQLPEYESTKSPENSENGPLKL